MDNYRPSEIYQSLPDDQGQGLNVFEERHFRIDALKDFENKLTHLDNRQLSTALDYFYMLRKTQKANGEDRYVDQEIIFDYIQILLSVRAQKCDWIADSRAKIEHYFRRFPDLNSKQLKHCFIQSGIQL